MGYKGVALSSRRVYQIVVDVGRVAGVGLHPHALRHTYATRLLRAGVDLVVVSALLGHRAIETTRRYTLPSADEMSAAVEQAFGGREVLRAVG